MWNNSLPWENYIINKILWHQKEIINFIKVNERKFIKKITCAFSNMYIFIHMSYLYKKNRILYIPILHIPILS